MNSPQNSLHQGFCETSKVILFSEASWLPKVWPLLQNRDALQDLRQKACQLTPQPNRGCRRDGGQAFVTCLLL